MSTSKTSFSIVALLVSAAAVGCTAQPEDITDKGTGTPSGQSTAQLQEQINVFTHALVERDVTALSGIVSSEIRSRGVERGVDMGSFLDKQRSAIIRTFGLAEGEYPAFEVSEVLPEGDAVRVTLRFRGEDLKKPFYFVRENGTLKVNIAPPGFAKTAPEGALFATSNYTVHNVNIPGNAPVTMSCYVRSLGDGSGLVTVSSQSTKKVKCRDNCGFWSGTQFTGPTGATRSCDWNAWGDDVVINLLAAEGWYCNDGC